MPKPMLESLESRQLLSAAPTVRLVVADNRGDVLVYFNSAMNGSTMNESDVLMYTAGKDGKLGTSDDKKVHIAVDYSTTAKALKIKTDLTANIKYYVEITKAVHDLNGLSIVSAKPPTNANLAYEFESVPPAANTDPVIIFTSNFGTINVEMYETKVGVTVNNFLSYANSGKYDNSIIHRSLPTADISTNGIAVLQGGGYYATLNSSGIPTAVTAGNPIPLQAKYSNATGTIAVALEGNSSGGTEPNSGTDEWYFNTADNTALDPTAGTKGSGYAVFGKVTSQQGLNTLMAIDAITPTSLTDPTNSGAFTAVPVEGGQFVIFSRIAVRDTATPVASV